MPVQIAPGIFAWSRAELGLGPSGASKIDPRQLWEFIVHHSTGSNLGNPALAAWWRNIRDYHVNTLGWSDVAYNNGVGRDVNPQFAHVLAGRGADRVGGHTLNHNSTGEAAVLLGDGRDPAQLTPGVLRAFALLNFLHHARPRVRDPITTTHGRVNPGSTACPGTVLDRETMAGFPGAGGAPAPGPATQPQPVGVDWNAIKRMIDEAKRLVLRKFPEPKPAFTSWAVKIAQARLHDLGHDPGPLDGVFWTRTDGAVRAFQRSRGLGVDGVIGPQTWKALIP